MERSQIDGLAFPLHSCVRNESGRDGDEDRDRERQGGG